jgi:ubiquinone/menaquinone biosynthesis C-methylase UbiE
MRKQRLEEEFELGEEEEAIHEYEALTDDYLHINASLIAEEIAQLVKATSGVAVDLGTGPGSLARAVAARCPALVVVGLDISLPMTRLARDRIAAEGISNVAFVVADVHHLPFSTSSLAAIISHGAMHHWRSLAQALTEIKKALAATGLLYLSDLTRTAPDDVVQHIAALLNPKQARAFINSVQAAYTIEELARLTAEAGLNTVRIEPEEFSRRTIARNIEKLRRSAMRGLRQPVINIRVVSTDKKPSATGV